MVRTGFVSVFIAGGCVAATVVAGSAWAGGPIGPVDDPNHASEAVGTGTFTNALVGFHATGATNEEAAANVIAKCQLAGGQDCTADEVTNEDLCIVSVADDGPDVVAGGAGVTVEAARDDALRRAAANGTPLPPTASVVISDCHGD